MMRWAGHVARGAGNWYVILAGEVEWRREFGRTSAWFFIFILYNLKFHFDSHTPHVYRVVTNRNHAHTITYPTFVQLTAEPLTQSHMSHTHTHTHMCIYMITLKRNLTPHIYWVYGLKRNPLRIYKPPNSSSPEWRPMTARTAPFSCWKFLSPIWKLPNEHGNWQLNTRAC
jgi:hypothetical protein